MPRVLDRAGPHTSRRHRGTLAAPDGRWAGLAAPGPESRGATAGTTAGRPSGSPGWRRGKDLRVSAMLVAHARISAQLRKSPSAARMAEAMARSGKLRCFLTSLPVKIWWSRAVVSWRILVMSTGLSAGLGGSPTGPLENSHTGRAAPARARVSSTGPCTPRCPAPRRRTLPLRRPVREGPLRPQGPSRPARQRSPGRSRSSLHTCSPRRPAPSLGPPLRRCRSGVIVQVGDGHIDRYSRFPSGSLSAALPRAGSLSASNSPYPMTGVDHVSGLPTLAVW
jgi:hypothetical protein